jgi:hypothetical protein
MIEDNDDMIKIYCAYMACKLAALYITVTAFGK